MIFVFSRLVSRSLSLCYCPLLMNLFSSRISFPFFLFIVLTWQKENKQCIKFMNFVILRTQQTNWSSIGYFPSTGRVQLSGRSGRYNPVVSCIKFNSAIEAVMKASLGNGVTKYLFSDLAKGRIWK